MYSISLRFAENFAPEEGTIKAHQRILDNKGYVWYGKLGNAISEKNIRLVMSQEDPKILLIHSGKAERYWAYIDAISREIPKCDEFPNYYSDKTNSIKTWFRVKKFEIAEKSVMSKCTVASSGALLTEVSKHSMNPYFFIEYNEDED